MANGVIPAGYTYRDGCGYFKDDDNSGPYVLSSAGTMALMAVAGASFAGDLVSTANSSAVVLAGAAAFTGTAVDTLGYACVTVGVIASHASGTDGLSIQQSSDGTNWDSADAYTVPATTGKVFQVNTSLRYIRVVYTNGATLQTYFRMQTILRVQPATRGSVQRPQDARTNDNDFDESLAYGMIYNGTSWDRARGDTTNGLDVDVTRVIPGVTATALGKAEDAAHTSGDTGVLALAVRRDTLGARTDAANDYSEMSVGSFGEALVRSYEKHARTYSATAVVTVAASATDIAIIPGNGSSSVYVTKVIVSGTQTTGGAVLVQLIKRSTANSGGTPAAMTAIAHNAADTAALSAPLAYTANPTPGATVGNVRASHIPIPATTGLVAPHVWEFGDKGRPIILSGVTQGLAVNLAGVSVAGGSFSITYEWFEV